MKSIIVAALVAATPAVALAQAAPGTQLGNSMGSDAAAQPHSRSADVASGAVGAHGVTSARRHMMTHHSSKTHMSHAATTPGN